MPEKVEIICNEKEETMKCKAIKYVPAEFTADIAGVTLLSKEEYEAARNVVPLLYGWWWLRSPGNLSLTAAYVDGGGVGGDGDDVGRAGGSVRPALRLNPKSVDLQIGEKVWIAGHTWTVIPGDLALCDGSIGEHCFREDWEAPDANDYEASDVKQYIEKWAQENGLLPKEICVRDVAGITLLSAKEYREAKDIVPQLDGWWWLRSPGRNSRDAAFVLLDGGVYGNGFNVDVAGVSVRPALRLNPESDNLQIGGQGPGSRAHVDRHPRKPCAVRRFYRGTLLPGGLESAGCRYIRGVRRKKVY